MNAYVDASVILREVLKQHPTLSEWDNLVIGVSSQLARIECFRTLDRLRLGRAMSPENLAEIGERVVKVFGSLDVLPIDEEALSRASNPLPSPPGTLDAIHLATAQMYRDRQPPDEPPIYFATFDIALATAARETGFRVLGA